MICISPIAPFGLTACGCEEPRVSAPSILSLPDEVDVRKLTRAFRTTIRDPKVLFEREVQIPAMSVTPASWLIDNAGLTTEQVNSHWRGGHIDGGGAGYWTSSGARMRAPSKPWAVRDDPRIRRNWSPPRAISRAR